MAVEYSIDVAHNLIHRVVRGLVDTDDLVHSIEATVNHPDFRTGMLSLTDLREAAHHSGPEDIRRISGLISRYIERISGGRAAVVVSQAVSFGMMRMLQAYTDTLPFEIKVFYDLVEARRWLGLEEG